MFTHWLMGKKVKSIQDRTGDAQKEVIGDQE